MQTYQSFVPNYPPPPIPTRESIIHEGLKLLEQSKIDHQWLKIWLERKKEQQQDLTSTQVTLFEYRQKLIQHAHLLQQYVHALNHSNRERLLELKNQIEQSNNFIYDAELIRNIQKKIQRRKAKRARLRRRKEEKVSIDMIEEQQSTNEKSLEEKIREINALLQTIKNLKQSKNNRQPQQPNSQTLDELTQVENLCTTKLHEYQQEIERKAHGSDIDLYNSLFNNNDRSFYESINSDAHDFLRAHQNVNDLIETRQAWDQYLTPHFSSLNNIIPVKWHEPQTPCNANWAQYIFDKKRS
ncbi:hypothetical protein I4U23_024908 [Adineta vaga]|nr:hypothetical protein I4U23_024908 [Adineta vaga]